MTTTQTASTTTWLIVANGMEMGSYPGATREEALEAYARDAGYESLAECAAVQSKSVTALLRELDVTEEG